MESANRLKYRSDIDGLRAIAILLVLFFHSPHILLPGGFVGVDVFFVISGFLITTIIWQSADANQFSMGTFLVRRIRRIYPNLLVSTVLTFAAASYFYLSDDLVKAAYSGISAVVGISNILYWLTTGYFSDSSRMSPFLHTWSLGVEEQFYLSYSLLIWIGRKFFRRNAVAMFLALIGLFALVACVLIPNTQTSTAFFMTPFRAWEFVFGGAIVLFPRPFQWLQARSGMWAGIGLAFILGSAFCLDESLPYPGAYAIAPTLGAMLLIGSMKDSPSRIHGWLGTKALVYIGRSSYSLYLWHWPVTCFQFYLATQYRAEPESLGFADNVIYFFLSIGLGLVSYHFLEDPVRRGKVIASNSRLIAVCITSSLMFMVVGLTVIYKRGFPERFDHSIARVLEQADDKSTTYEASVDDLRNATLHTLGDLESQTPSILLWGDSHAMAITPALNELAKEYKCQVAVATHSSTAPLLDFSYRDSYTIAEADRFAREVLAYIRAKNIRQVLIVAYWSRYVKGTADAPEDTRRSETEFFGSLKKTLQVLEDSQVQYWIMEEVPTFPWSVPRAMVRETINHRDPQAIGMSRSEHLQRTRLANTCITQALSEIGASHRFISPLPIFEKEDDWLSPVADQLPLFRDSNHVSRYGSLKLKDKLRPIFEPLR